MTATRAMAKAIGTFAEPPLTLVPPNAGFEHLRPIDGIDLREPPVSDTAQGRARPRKTAPNNQTAVSEGPG